MTKTLITKAEAKIEVEFDGDKTFDEFISFYGDKEEYFYEDVLAFLGFVGLFN